MYNQNGQISYEVFLGMSVRMRFDKRSGSITSAVWSVTKLWLYQSSETYYR